MFVVNDVARYLSVYSLAWLVIVGVVGAVLGAWLGNLVARVRSKAAVRIQELEAQLESARGEISSYRREVFDQFAETASKFRSLDQSYNDLHRQLAKSASVLCGEAAGPLLEAPVQTEALVVPPAATSTVAEKAAELDEQPETVAEVEDEHVPILLAEVSPPAAAANGEEAADAERPSAPRSHDDDVDDEPAPKRLGDAA